MNSVPTAERARSLRTRREQLEAQFRRCRTASEQSAAPNPSLGRELDDVRALLATVRKELTSLERR